MVAAVEWAYFYVGHADDCLSDLSVSRLLGKSLAIIRGFDQARCFIGSCGHEATASYKGLRVYLQI